jgi:hypothetical protein
MGGVLPVEGLAEAYCEEHDATRLGGDNGYSSPCIHKHREGVLLPLGPTNVAVPLISINIDAEATFFSCHVRNFIVNVKADFVIDVSSSPTDAPLPVAFPITTHALYGDHSHFRDIMVSIGNVQIPYRVAMDYAVWNISSDGLRYKSRLVNHLVHPLLENAKDLRLIAPHLAAKGYDLVLYWYMPSPGSASNHIIIEYTSNNNDFSDCCREVHQCTYGNDPYHFYFDLSNANYWPGPKQCRVTLRDSGSAQWTGVPKTNMHTETTPDTIILTSSPANIHLEDIAVPVQPAVFDCWPRNWSENPSTVQEFTLSWLDGAPGMIDSAVIDQIIPTQGIVVYADLPIILDEKNPSGTFTASYMPPIPELTYFDVIGKGCRGPEQNPHGLYDISVRVPLNGKTIMGHDLAASDLWIEPGISSNDWMIHVTVSNIGLFTEPLLVTVLVDNVFVKTEGFRSLLPGDVVNLTIPIQWIWELPAEVEVEVEPAPGEVKRMNNSVSITYPTSPPLPRHADFVLHPDQSRVRLIHDSGIVLESKLLGDIRLYLGDPDVPVIAIVGMVGLSVDDARLMAPHFKPTTSANEVCPKPLYMYQDPCVQSIGSWNTITGEINFQLHLKTPEGEPPAPQPMSFTGTLTNAGLCVKGISADSTNVPKMIMDIFAHERPLPPKPDVWFSTEVGFHAANPLAEADSLDGIRYISPGDLLSVRGHIVRTNNELTAKLGIMPMVPDLGLDAVMLGPRRQIWFSFEEEIGQIWSETLGCWLKHGDLLSDAGRIVQTNQRLISRFSMMPPVHDVGLDALTHAEHRAIYFSTEDDFFSEALGVTVGHGDLLSNRGHIIRTNAQLMNNFSPSGPTISEDFGLDAVLLRANGEIWFSTETGFLDANLGPISDGDLLSTAGYVVATNLELVSKFGPIEDLDNFGLDAGNIIVPNYTDAYRNPSDVNEDGIVNIFDLAGVKSQLFRPVADENFRMDVNNDNIINIMDLGAVKAGLFKNSLCP